MATGPSQVRVVFEGRVRRFLTTHYRAAKQGIQLARNARTAWVEKERQAGRSVPEVPLSALLALSAAKQQIKGRDESIPSLQRPGRTVSVWLRAAAKETKRLLAEEKVEMKRVDAERKALKRSRLALTSLT